ncbi:hypothetical protein X747_25265 [Mesorhizobium sp. LNJC384A00]|nr:hypothetical protein X766_31805 [Mesorhizobium sp. LSJC255A00]ESY17214.1 hypothetical protein X749_30855 [Mesorhizobium sp. LNJC391B00]ESY37902.1 hypothetical protein X747_25265 [Mesorhizobium sp. LNJC384A00]
MAAALLIVIVPDRILPEKSISVAVPPSVTVPPKELCVM